MSINQNGQYKIKANFEKIIKEDDLDDNIRKEDVIDKELFSFESESKSPISKKAVSFSEDDFLPKQRPI